MQPNISIGFLFLCRVPFHVDDDLAIGGKFDGVADQVDDDLPQPTGVSNQPVRDVFGNAASQFQSLAVRPNGQSVGGIIEVVAQVEVDRVQVQLAGLDLGRVENIVDHRPAGSRRTI